MNPPTCNISLSGTQNVPANALTAVTFDSELFDPYGFHSTSVNATRITPSVPGRYAIGGLGVFAANSTGGRELLIRSNGTTNLTGGGTLLLATSFGATEMPVAQVSMLFNGSTDYIEMVVNQTSGGTLNMSGSALNVRWVGLT